MAKIISVNANLEAVVVVNRQACLPSTLTIFVSVIYLLVVKNKISRYTFKSCRCLCTSTLK